MIFTSRKHPTHGSRSARRPAVAIVDGVLEGGRLLLLDGTSMRTKHLGFDAPAHTEARTQLVSDQRFRNPHHPFERDSIDLPIPGL